MSENKASGSTRLRIVIDQIGDRIGVSLIGDKDVLTAYVPALGDEPVFIETTLMRVTVELLSDDDGGETGPELDEQDVWSTLRELFNVEPESKEPKAGGGDAG